MQNELIKLMAHHVQRKIAANLQSTEFISVMIDEWIDVNNQEQVDDKHVLISLYFGIIIMIGNCCFAMGR